MAIGIKLFKVQGRSMMPEYFEDDIVVCMRLPFQALRKDQNIVIKHPYYQTIVKKIIEVLPSGDVKVKGNGPQSTPTEAIGVVHRDWVLGKVILHFPAHH